MSHRDTWLTLIDRFDPDVPVVNAAWRAPRVLDEQRRQRETGLHTGHIRILEAIARDPEHRLPDDPLAHELLSYGHLLPYPNESEWYYPHPLLLRHMLKV